MRDLERLIEIARVLPPPQVHALLSVAEQMAGFITDEEFLRKINTAPPIEVDEETATELRAALAERGETVGHEELKRELGLA